MRGLSSSRLAILLVSLLPLCTSGAICCKGNVVHQKDGRQHQAATSTQQEESFQNIEVHTSSKIRIILRYTACSGLINQQYSHIAAFALAAALGSELVLPPAVQRDSFANYYHVDNQRNEVTWTPAPLSTLLDVDSIEAAWRLKGVTVHKTPGLLGFPDMLDPGTAYPQYCHDAIDERFTTHVGDVFLKTLDLEVLLQKARAAVSKHAESLYREDPDIAIKYIVLDLPCTFFMIRTRSNLLMTSQIAATLDFSVAIKQLANNIISKLTMGQAKYNSVHLRIEKDARDWAELMEGQLVMWNLYRMAMQKSFDAATPLYVASGLLSYGGTKDFYQVQRKLRRYKVCSTIYYKEMFLGKHITSALTSEQQALVDFLVLANGSQFIGFEPSTFSFYLREFRALKGLNRSTSILIKGTNIGTDSIFAEAGYVAPLKEGLCELNCSVLELCQSVQRLQAVPWYTGAHAEQCYDYQSHPVSFGAADNFWCKQ